MLLSGIRLSLIIYIWMVTLVPASPWRDTYEDTAVAIAEVVEANPPLYRNDETRIKTAATLVALARFESVFDVNAWGDRGKGDSHGLYQQQRFGELRDPREATGVAISQIAISLRNCASRPIDERLAWYAAGGDGCSNPAGIAKSRNRMKLARQLAGE